MTRRCIAIVAAMVLTVSVHVTYAQSANDIVLYATDFSTVRGNWAIGASGSGAGGQGLATHAAELHRLVGRAERDAGVHLLHAESDDETRLLVDGPERPDYAELVVGRHLARHDVRSLSRSQVVHRQVDGLVAPGPGTASSRDRSD